VGNALPYFTFLQGSGGIFYGQTLGGFGESNSTDPTILSTGLLGAAFGSLPVSQPGGVGVAGATAGETGIGVYGENNSVVANDNAIGVYGLTTNPSGTGVVGDGQTGNNGWGVYGICGDGNNQIGVVGEVTGTGNTSRGVLGVAQMGGANRYGLVGLNDFAATGLKAFIMDHPADPANQYLKHYCVEGPEIVNMYRGNVVLDTNGEAVVTLPDYFTLINNQNITYNLTPIGGQAQLFIKQETTSGQFSIAGGAPGMKVSWMITAERNDPYLQQYPEERMVVVPKNELAGTYLQPELYDQPSTAGQYYRPNAVHNRGTGRSYTRVQGESRPHAMPSTQHAEQLRQNR
jgi:hypothetical protein